METTTNRAFTMPQVLLEKYGLSQVISINGGDLRKLREDRESIAEKAILKALAQIRISDPNTGKISIMDAAYNQIKKIGAVVNDNLQAISADRETAVAIAQITKTFKLDVNGNPELYFTTDNGKNVYTSNRITTELHTDETGKTTYSVSLSQNQPEDKATTDNVRISFVVDGKETKPILNGTGKFTNLSLPDAGEKIIEAANQGAKIFEGHANDADTQLTRSGYFRKLIY